MAGSPRLGRRLTIITAAAMAFCLLVPITGSKPAWAKERPKRHLLSWESLQIREQYRKWGEYQRSERRVSVKKLGVIRLKRSSFWNKRPFQFSTPAVYDSTIYIGVDAGFFYGIDAQRIKKIWEYKTEGPVQAPAVVEGDVVYFGDADGHAYALSAVTGEEIWKVRVGAPIFSAPLLYADRVYFVTDDAQLVALSKSGGATILTTDPYPKTVGFSVRRGSSPVLAGDLILFGSAQGLLLAYTTNGQLAWARQLGDRQALVCDVDSRPLTEGGGVYVATADQQVYYVNAKDGTVVWSIPNLGGGGDLLISGQDLYVTGGGVLSKVSATGGSLAWQQDLETPEISSPAKMGDYLAVVSTSDKFYLVDPATGDIIYDRFVRKGSFGDPVFYGDNNLVILSNTGRLFAFHIKEKPPKKHKKR